MILCIISSSLTWLDCFSPGVRWKGWAGVGVVVDVAWITGTLFYVGRLFDYILAIQVRLNTQALSVCTSSGPFSAPDSVHTAMNLDWCVLCPVITSHAMLVDL